MNTSVKGAPHLGACKDIKSSDTIRSVLPIQQHMKFLRERAVRDDVAAERGYRSAEKKTDLEKLGFGRTQQLVPALIIPICSARGAIESYQLHPDTPRLNKKGKLLKYEMKSGSKMLL